MLPHHVPAPQSPQRIGVGIDASRYGQYAAFLRDDLQPCPYRKCCCGRFAHSRATTIVTRSIGLALNGPYCVDPAGRRGFQGPQALREILLRATDFSLRARGPLPDNMATRTLMRKSCWPSPAQGPP